MGMVQGTGCSAAKYGMQQSYLSQVELQQGDGCGAEALPKDDQRSGGCGVCKAPFWLFTNVCCDRTWGRGPSRLQPAQYSSWLVVQMLSWQPSLFVTRIQWHPSQHVCCGSWSACNPKPLFGCGNIPLVFRFLWLHLTTREQLGALALISKMG